MRDTQHERQQQLAADLRRAEEVRLQIEQAKKTKLSQQRELTLQHEQNRGLGIGR